MKKTNHSFLLKEIGFDPENHLSHNMIPYWNKLKDTEYGGFFGAVNSQLEIDRKADKGIVLQTRILWFYSSIYLSTKNKQSLEMANHAFDFLKKYCFDVEYGGLYWMLKYDGSMSESEKVCYAQAFGIYALSTYYRAAGKKEALNLAYRLFECIETYCTDAYGYVESFNRNWKEPVESAICDQGVVADKTMNTLLHILEAYTDLYLSDSHLQVRKKLLEILHLIYNKVYNPKENRLEVFFDEKMNSVSDFHSYGHDIEACWLLDRACDVLEEVREKTGAELRQEEFALFQKTRLYTTHIAKRVYETGYENNSLAYQRFNDSIDQDRVWWAQAEAVVGFINEYQKNGDPLFLEASKNILLFIEKYLVDSRPGGEWFWSVSIDGKADMENGITGPWKCPYHNGRMCLELLSRAGANKKD